MAATSLTAALRPFPAPHTPPSASIRVSGRLGDLLRSNGHSPPVCLELTLLPFMGKIVYDGMLGGKPLPTAAGFLSELQAVVDEARRVERIVTELPTPTPAPLQGRPCVIRGLQSRPALNGTIAVATELIRPKGRYACRLPRRGADGKYERILLKPESLVLATAGDVRAPIDAAEPGAAAEPHEPRSDGPPTPSESTAGDRTASFAAALAGGLSKSSAAAAAPRASPKGAELSGASQRVVSELIGMAWAGSSPPPWVVSSEDAVGVDATEGDPAEGGATEVDVMAYDGEEGTMWVFRRIGYTEGDNPEHLFMVAPAGEEPLPAVDMEGDGESDRDGDGGGEEPRVVELTETVREGVAEGGGVEGGGSDGGRDDASGVTAVEEERAEAKEAARQRLCDERLAARELAKRVAAHGKLVPTGLFHTSVGLEPTVTEVLGVIRRSVHGRKWAGRGKPHVVAVDSRRLKDELGRALKPAGIRVGYYPPPTGQLV